ncbi:MAG: hypothetical protein SNJ78_12005, partial [Spirochaetales bacterium]
NKISGLKQELAVELVKRLESPAVANRLLAEVQQPTSTKPSPEVLGKVHPLLSTILTTYAKINKVAYPTDVAPPPAIDNAIKRIAIPAIIEGAMSPEEAAKEVNLRAREYYKK